MRQRTTNWFAADSRQRLGRTILSLQPLEVRALLSGFVGPIAPSADDRYISAVFNDVLRRPAESADLAYFSAQIAAGMPFSGVANAAAHSEEYRENVVVRPDYVRYLGRAASAADVAFWSQQMRAGLTDEQLGAAIVASDEFFRAAGATNASWLDAAYESVLQRPVDPEAGVYWMSQLSAGASRDQIALSLTASPERETARIEDDYQQVLRQPITSESINYWVAQLAGGMSDEDLIAYMASSDDYFKSRTSQTVAVTPEANDLAWWVQDNDAIDARAQQGAAGVLFLGDSLTYGWTYYAADVWNQYFSDDGPMQAGIPGDTTENVLWRLEHGNLNGIDPKLVVLMIGTNNLSYGDSPADTAAGIQADIDAIRRALPDTRILLMGISPRGTLDDPLRKAAADTNAIIQGFADDASIYYIDISAALLTPDGDLLPGAYFSDNVHLTPAGYRIWAESIEPTVTAILSS